MLMSETIILVDEEGNQVGTGEKLEVHRAGLLHRAFSIYVFNNKGEMLLQERALGKYHSGGLWTNTCCGHPRVEEEIEPAAHRRLMEEFGFECELSEISTFRYKVALDHGLTENEFLHVFIGHGNVLPQPNPEEIGNWKWVSVLEVTKDIANHPQHYTEWFKLIMQDTKKIAELSITASHGH
jgi:isopentenyl-diphosphate delta-isomerase